MNIPTLKVHEYRHKKIFVRHLYREVFEILIPAYGQLYQHHHQFSKKRSESNRRYTPEELKSVTEALTTMGEILTDDIIFQHKESMKIGNVLKRLWKRSKGYAKYIHYKLGIIYDGIQEQIILWQRRRTKRKENVDGVK